MGAEPMKAVLGIALVVGFVVIIVLCVIADKNAGKKFMKKIQDTYQIKDKQGNLIITTNNEILLSLGSGSLPGYKKWNLEDIAYFGMSTLQRTNCGFSFLDENRKAMKGEYLTPSKKPLVQKGMAAFPARSPEALEEMYAFVKKHKPDLQKCRNGEISE